MKRTFAIAIPLLATALVVAAAVLQLQTAEPVLGEDVFERLGEIPGCKSKVLPVGENTKNVLPADTTVESRLYTADDGSWHVVTLVIGGRSKSSIHRPELCLPSQGLAMSEPRTTVRGGVEWRRLVIDGNAAGRATFAYTFYNQDGYRTSSHLLRIFRDVWDRSFNGRIDRWAMLTVLSNELEDVRFGRFLEKLKGLVR